VRDLRSVATSYSKRAAAPEDPWVEGRVGLIAMGDALLLLHALHNVPKGSNVLILPQGALLADWQAVMTRALGHISPEIEPEFDAEKLKVINRIKTREEQREKPALHPVEPRALTRLERDGVIDFFTRPEPVLLDDVRDEITAILERTPQNPIAFIRRKVEEHPNPKAAEFFERWARQAGRAWRLYRDAAPAPVAAKAPEVKTPAKTPAETPAAES
jgi:hypothetical protein